MKILLDEGLSEDFIQLFVDSHQVLTVAQMGWRGKKNGALLPLARQAACELLITLDRQMQRQQSARTTPFPVIVLEPRSQGITDTGNLIGTRVLPLLSSPLKLGYYFVPHEGPITFKLPLEQGKGSPVPEDEGA